MLFELQRVNQSVESSKLSGENALYEAMTWDLYTPTLPYQNNNIQTYVDNNELSEKKLLIC